MEENFYKGPIGNGGISEDKVPKVLILLGIGIVLLGILFLMMGYFFSKTVVGYEKTTGIVVSYNRKSKDGSYLYAEIIEYTVDGETYRCYASSYSTHPKSIGDKMKVYYDPNDPSESEARAKQEKIIMFLVGGVLFLLGCGLLVSGIKEKRKLNDEKVLL